MSQPNPSAAGAPAARGRGHIASLVCGLLAIPFSVLLLGGVLGAVGVHYGRRHRRSVATGQGMAKAGMVLSSVGIVLALGFAGIYAYIGVLAARQHRDSQDLGAYFRQWEGAAAPDFQITALDGEEITSASLRGRRVALVVFSTRCGACRRELLDLQALLDDWGPGELAVIALSPHDEAAVRQFAARHDLRMPVGLFDDTALPRPFSESRYPPTTFILDRNGVIEHAFIGYRSTDDLAAWLSAPDYAEPLRTPPPPRGTTEPTA